MMNPLVPKNLWGYVNGGETCLLDIAPATPGRGGQHVTVVAVRQEQTDGM